MERPALTKASIVAQDAQAEHLQGKHARAHQGKEAREPNGRAF